MRECCNTVDHAVQLWLGGGPWEVERRTGSCGSVKLQSAPVSLMYSCLVRPDRQTAVIPNSSHPVAVIAQQWTPRVAHSHWKVGECVQFSKSLLVTDAVLIRRRIQRVSSLLNVECLSHPLTHWELITVQWTNSVYRLPSPNSHAGRQQVDSRIDRR